MTTLEPFSEHFEKTLKPLVFKFNPYTISLYRDEDKIDIPMFNISLEPIGESAPQVCSTQPEAMWPYKSKWNLDNINSNGF